MAIDKNIRPLEKKMLDAIAEFYDYKQESFTMDVLTKEGFMIKVQIDETEFPL